MPAPLTPTICNRSDRSVPATVTPTICNPSGEPDPEPCIGTTGAGVSTVTPDALANGVLDDVEFDIIDFEDPPSFADLPNDGIVAGAPGTYAGFFKMNFGGTLDVATATTFIYVDGVEVLSFLHVLTPATSSQSSAFSLVLAVGSLVQMFVRQDGALEGVSLDSASMSLELPCAA